MHSRANACATKYRGKDWAVAAEDRRQRSQDFAPQQHLEQRINNTLNAELDNAALCLQTYMHLILRQVF
jgi:hypothetical protein